MELQEIEKNDTITTKDGRTLRVLSVYKPAGTIVRVDTIDDSDANAMRRPVFAAEIAKILRKHTKTQSAPTEKTESLPEGQKVVQKEQAPPELDKDIKARPRHTATSSENQKQSSQVKK